MIRVLPDVSMQVLGGVETTRRLQVAWPVTSSVRHTATLDGSAVLGMHPAGTAGSQLTSLDMDGLIEAVCTAHEGGEAWDKRAAAILRRRTESAIRPSQESLPPESPAASDVLVLRRRR
jgi:DNA-binding NarL/FixJ family response regulator